MTRQRRASAVVFLVAGLAMSGGGCSTLPKPGKPAMTDVQFRMRDFRLANGMRIIVEADHASPLVGVFATVGVGSSSDPQGREGLAHLLEHLAFRAKPGGAVTAWTQLEEVGAGFFNATTSFDVTTYMEVGTRELLPKLLALEVGRLLDPMAGVDEKTFDVEREVVRNELRQRGENAIGPAFSTLQAAAFPKDHPYSRPVAGSHESLSRISFEDARAFAAEHYRPANITLLVIGDVDLASVQETLARALPPGVFQPAPLTKEPFPGRLPALVAEPPDPPQEKLLRQHAAVASPELYLVWSLPRSFDDGAVMLDFVNAAAERVLGGAFLSDPDLVDVEVFTVPGVEASMLVARATLRRADRVERTYERLLDQLVKLWASGEIGREYPADSGARGALARERAFGRLRNGALMAMMLGAENISRRGVERVQSAHFTGSPVTYGRRLRAMGGLSSAQVSHFAEKYLPRSRARAVLVEPFPLDAKRVADGPTGLAPVQAAPLTTPLPPEAVRRLGRAQADRSKAQRSQSPSREHLVETLPNGLKVVVQRRPGSLPLAVAQLTFTAGWAGTTPKGAAELATILASPRSHVYGFGNDYGIGWRTRLGSDRFTIVGTSANGNLPNLLAQLSEQVTSMHVETGAVVFFHREFADALASAEQLPLRKSERELDAALFPGHPLGDAALTSDLRTLTEAELDRWFRRAWSPDRAVLVVTGDLDAEVALAQVKAWLGDWKPAEEPFPLLPPPKVRQGPPAVLITHQPGATQAQVHLACLVRERSVEDALSARATASVVGAALFDRLRSELGASYGFGGVASPLLGGVERLDWRGAIENGRLKEGLSALEDVLGHVGPQALDDGSVDRARWQVARELTLSEATSLQSSTELTQQALAHRDLGADALFESLASVGRAQVLEAWGQCQGSLAVALVGDEPTIRQALTKTSFSSLAAAPKEPSGVGR